MLRTCLFSILPSLVLGTLTANAGAQSTEPSVIVRLPRFEPLQQIVIPAAAKAAQLTELRAPPSELFNKVFDVPHAGKLTGLSSSDCIGVRVTLSLARQQAQATGNAFLPVKVSYPDGALLHLQVDEQTFQLSATDSDGVLLTVAAESDRAEIKTGLKATTHEEAHGSCTTPFAGIDPLKDLATETQSENVSLKGLSVRVTGKLAASGGELSLQQIRSAHASIGRVSVDPCRDPDALIRWINSNLKQSFPTCTRELTDGVNDLLEGKLSPSFNLTQLARQATSDGLATVGVSVPAQLPLAGAGTLSTTSTLGKLSAPGGGLLSQWSVRVRATEARAGLALPPLRSKLRAGAQDGPAGKLGSGDLAVSVPLELLDQILYEALRAGLLPEQLQVPLGTTSPECSVVPRSGAASALQVTKSVSTAVQALNVSASARGLTATLQFLDAPLAGVAADGRRLSFEARVRLATPAGAANSASAEGTLRIQLSPVASEGGRIVLKPAGVELANLTGTVNVCGSALPVSPQHLDALARALTDSVQQRLGQGLPLRMPDAAPAGVGIVPLRIDLTPAYLTVSFRIQQRS